jgi:8-oxo-dGTP diphosphatase
MAGSFEIPKDRNVKSSTLCYIEKDGCYLMMDRVVKENDVNHDKWIGVGGHFEEGETADECLVREVREETGVVISDYRYRGLITFVPPEGSIELMHLYTATLDGADLSGSIIGSLVAAQRNSTGTESESNEILMDEGILKWIPKEKIWDLELWEGDRIFLNMLLEDRDFENMLLAYDEDDRLIAAELEGVSLL